MLYFLVFATTTCNPGKPDLVVDNITLTPANPHNKDEIRFIAVIKNKGTKPAPASVAAMLVAGDMYPQKFNIPPMHPGSTFTIRRTDSKRFHLAQKYRVTIYADFSKSVTERNENNNEKYKKFTVTKACPDLIINSITITPANPTTSDVIKFEISIVNIGNISASPTKVTIKIGAETNPKIFPIPALNPGAAHTILRSERLNTARNYRVSVYADYGNNSVECCENNNEMHKNFRVN